MRTPIYSLCRPVGPLAFLVALLAGGVPAAYAATVRTAPSPTVYPDGRPAARYRLDAQDYGPVLRHGGGPDRCDELGARDVWVWEHGGTYFLPAAFCLVVGADLDNGRGVKSVPDFAAAGVRRAEYRGELEQFRNEFGGSRALSAHPFFLFGTGLRPKFLYKAGTLFQAESGTVFRQWEGAEEVIRVREGPQER